MKKIILPFFVCVIACFTITSCSKDVKSPVAKTTSAATTKKPTSNTQAPGTNQTTNQSDHQGGCNHSSNGYGSGSSGGYNGY